MKVLFLDVDGVLNRCGMSAQGLESDKLGLLRRIIMETGCNVVLSSTWRKFDRLLVRIKAEIELHDVTPCLDEIQGGLWTAQPRGMEISTWLGNHPQVERYVILDDDSDMGALKPHLVGTQSFIGLTPRIAAEVIERLNRK